MPRRIQDFTDPSGSGQVFGQFGAGHSLKVGDGD